MDGKCFIGTRVGRKFFVGTRVGRKCSIGDGVAWNFPTVD